MMSPHTYAALIEAHAADVERMTRRHRAPSTPRARAERRERGRVRRGLVRLHLAPAR